MADLNTLKKDELVALAEANEIDSSGNKPEIIERLTDAGIEAPESDVPQSEPIAGEENYTQLVSPLGFTSSVPDSIVERLLESGYTKA